MQPEPANISTHWVLAAVYSGSLKMPIMHLIWAYLSLSLCQIYWMPQVKLWFLSALCRETDWALRCLATGWNPRDQLFMGRDADPWEMFSFSFFLFSFEFNELPKHKSVTTAAHKCPNQDFWMRFITNSNWCWVLWRRSRLQKHRNK